MDGMEHPDFYKHQPGTGFAQQLSVAILTVGDVQISARKIHQSLPRQSHAEEQMGTAAQQGLLTRLMLQAC